MKYNLSELICKYVKVGTPECEEFLKACSDLGLTWKNGDDISSYRPDKGVIAVSGSGRIGCNEYEEYYLEFSYSQFVPKTDDTQRTAESSAVKTLESLGYVWNGGEQWKPPIGNAPSYITDEIDNTVTQRGERYGLFADGAVIMQELKAVMRATHGWERLTPSQREALEMIQHKIGRVLNGDPTYDDSWRDIAGYATLILNELNGVKR